jgi:hypothetical protein
VFAILRGKLSAQDWGYMNFAKRLAVGVAVAAAVTGSASAGVASASGRTAPLEVGTSDPYPTQVACLTGREIFISNGFNVGPCERNPIKMQWFFLYWD